MIKPTVGRVVWYRPTEHDRLWMEVKDDQQPLAAIVAYVWSPVLVNLTVLDHNGTPHPVSSVALHQEEHPCTASPYCEWMPYQKGQAAKAEALEQKLGGAA